MLLRFMATDRAFAKWRRSQKSAEPGTPTSDHESGIRTGIGVER
jgi:hypothetical protein